MAKLSAAEFAAFLLARAKKKDGYIMGAVGQNPKKWGTGSWYFTQYSGAQRTKALYWRENAERVWDCQGLAEGYINDMLGTDLNVYARTNFAHWCEPKGDGRIPAEYRKPGAAVFYHNGARVSHVGYLVKPVAEGKPEGDWYVIEARGVMYGVVKTRLYARSWNRWGLMTRYLDYGDTQSAAPAESVRPAESSGRVVIDISRWNGRIKDVGLLKSAVAFVIHRASCGLNKDAVFDYNASIMSENSLPFGVYHYLKALTADEAREEARLFYKTAAPYAPRFWAADCEYAKITALVKTKGAWFVRKIVNAFVNELVSLGAKRDRIGVYIGHHLYKLWALEYENFAFVWIPRYGTNDGTPQKKPAYACDLWQYTSVGQCPGLDDKSVDLNMITGSGRDEEWFIGEEG